MRIKIIIKFYFIMKGSLIVVLLLFSFTVTEVPSTNTDTTKVETIDMFETTDKKSPVLGCEEGKPDLCTCIAAGGCAFDPGSSCRIEYCSGAVDEDGFNSSPQNITTITQPCPEEPQP